MKKLPIDISDFRKVIRDNNYFIHKRKILKPILKELFVNPFKKNKGK